MEFLNLFQFTLLFSALIFGLGLFRRRKLPPGPIGLPLVGNLFEIGTKPHQSLANLAKKYGPLMTVRLGSKTLVVASSPEMAQQVLQKHDEAFSGRVISDTITKVQNYDLNLVWMPSGDKSRLIRRALSTFLLHPKKLDTLVGLRHKTMQELVQHVTKMSETGEAVDIGKLAFITALNQMSNTCFSMNVADYNSGEAQGFLNAVKTVMFVVGQFNIADVFPWLKPLDPQGLKRRAKVAYNWLNSVSNEFVTKRLQHRKLNIARHGDMLDSLLDYVQEELELNYECVKVLLVELLLGGTETSSITTEWVMTELILNPNIMATVREEIQKKVGDKERIEESDVLELPSLQAVIKETMRLHLTVPLLVPHKTETEVELNGYVIPKNTQTIVNAWAIARDPKYWEEPTVFKPERFLNSKLDFKGQHFSFIPFGSGRRMCPGIPLAHRVVSLMVASLVYHFDWNLPHGLTPEKLDMNDIFGLTLQRAIPLMAVPTICQK